MYIYIYIYICTADKLPQIGECPVVMISAEKKVNPKPQTSKEHTPICVLILQHMCPHTTTYVSSYCYVRVRIQLYMFPHTAICVLIPLYFSREEGNK